MEQEGNLKNIRNIRFNNNKFTILPDGSEALDNGDILTMSVKGHDYIYRFSGVRNKIDHYYYSSVNFFGEFDMNNWSCHSGSHGRTCRKATQKESDILVMAEHSNGFYWDGNDLIDMPKYVAITKIHEHTWQRDYRVGHVFKLEEQPIEDNKYWRVGLNRVIDIENSEPSAEINFILQDTPAYKPISMDDWTFEFDTAILPEKPTLDLDLNISCEMDLKLYSKIVINVEGFELNHEDGKITITPKK